jgi:Tfp pilus assembly protein PilV
MRIASNGALRRGGRRSRAGITVVEVLAALVVVSVGLLGMAGTSALALRTSVASARERRALGRVELRLAALASAGCAAAAGGSAPDAGDGVRERWTVEAARRGAAMVEATAEWEENTRSRAMVLRSALLC